MNETHTENEVKSRINNLLWEILPSNTTLQRAEDLAVGMFYEYQQFMDSERVETPTSEDKLKEAIGWAAYLAKGRHCTESEAMEWLELVKNNAIEDERTRNDPE